jgi:hypothetical protein
MRKIFLTGMMSVCMVALMAQTGNANRREGGGQRGFNPEQRYERLKQELKLNDKQLDSLKVAERDLYAGLGRPQGQAREQQGQAREQRGENTADAQKRAEEMKKRNEQFEKRLKNFLTEEQIAKYKELRSRNRNPNQGQGNREERRNNR